ncbi:MAG: hypothetical protein WAM28_04205 [Chlamydiales bacterium]
MVLVKAKEMQKPEILSCEAMINNLWGELNTANIPHSIRMELELKLSNCEQRFNDVLAGQASLAELNEKLEEVDKKLAISAIKQAENEISKAEHTKSAFQGLENVHRELEEGKITPAKARHEVKDIMRHHS